MPGKPKSSQRFLLSCPPCWRQLWASMSPSVRGTPPLCIASPPALRTSMLAVPPNWSCQGLLVHQLESVPPPRLMPRLVTTPGPASVLHVPTSSHPATCPQASAGPPSLSPGPSVTDPSAFFPVHIPLTFTSPCSNSVHSLSCQFSS